MTRLQFKTVSIVETVSALLNLAFLALFIFQGAGILGVLYAYIFSNVSANSTDTKKSDSQALLYKEMKRSTLAILEKLKIDQQPNLHNRIMERLATSNEDDTRLLLSFAKYFNQLYE